MTSERSPEAFEDSAAWQKSRHLARLVYDATDNAAFRNDVELRAQMRRAVLTIMGSLADGHERNNPREFLGAVVHARSALAELRSALYLAQDLHFLDGRTFDSVNLAATELGRTLTGLRTALARRAEGGGPPPPPRDDRLDRGGRTRGGR